MDLKALTNIVRDCRTDKRFTFRTEDRNGELILYVVLQDTKWTGRRWIISRHATKSEVVQTLLKAVLTALEHEARESFTYKGRAIFGPHFDVEALVDLVDSRQEDRRAEKA